MRRHTGQDLESAVSGPLPREAAPPSQHMDAIPPHAARHASASRVFTGAASRGTTELAAGLSSVSNPLSRWLQVPALLTCGSFWCSAPPETLWGPPSHLISITDTLRTQEIPRVFEACARNWGENHYVLHSTATMCSGLPHSPGTTAPSPQPPARSPMPAHHGLPKVEAKQHLKRHR